MNDSTKGEFLRKRMIELREKNGMSQSDMAKLIHCDKATISRVENGNTSYKKILEYANEYCDKLELSEDQKKIFLRGDKVVVTDTSALLKNVQLIDELSKEYSHVIVPKIVIDELDYIKDHNAKLTTKARQILKSINNNQNILQRECKQKNANDNNDTRIIAVAKAASEEFSCAVDIITNDIGFSARLSGNDVVHALFLEEYTITRQELVDMTSIKTINAYYANSYENLEESLGARMPNEKDINAYLPNGYTLIISVVRNRKAPMNQRKAKIKWLIAHGADINKRDNGRYYFPPLSHAIQNGDFEMFKFLLHECKANPNIGSRNPHDAGKIRQKNDGNMPLMIAAWDNKIDFVKELVADERTSLNQQDGNGFTALIKACYWGWRECRDILLDAGADRKIVDRDGYTADGRYNEYLETGRKKKRNSNSKKKTTGGCRR